MAAADVPTPQPDTALVPVATIPIIHSNGKTTTKFPRMALKPFLDPKLFLTKSVKSNGALGLFDKFDNIRRRLICLFQNCRFNVLYAKSLKKSIKFEIFGSNALQLKLFKSQRKLFWLKNSKVFNIPAEAYIVKDLKVNFFKMAWGRLSHVVTVFSVITFTITLITLVFTYRAWCRRKRTDRLREDIIDLQDIVVRSKPKDRPMPIIAMDESEQLLNDTPTPPLHVPLPESSSSSSRSSSHDDVVAPDRDEGYLSWLWRMLFGTDTMGTWNHN